MFYLRILHIFISPFPILDGEVQFPSCIFMFYSLTDTIKISILSELWKLQLWEGEWQELDIENIVPGSSEEESSDFVSHKLFELNFCAILCFFLNHSFLFYQHYISFIPNKRTSVVTQVEISQIQFYSCKLIEKESIPCML